MIHKSKLLINTMSILGEGPVWDWKKKLLFWVDIEGFVLHSYDPSNGENQQWLFGEMIGAAVPTESGKILLALESGLATFDFESKKLIWHYVLENNDPLMRYNDGKVDSNGNFWIGSMHKKFLAQTGNLYRVAPNFETTIQIPNTTISNGMAWSTDHKKFYFIDSTSFEICSYDIDTTTAEIKNRNVAFTVPKDYGAPDGMCIDTENMLWIAHWGGGCVRRWDPKTGRVLEQIDVLAPNVTSCCFGREDLKTLYITTARSGLTEEQLKEFPLSGGLFIHQSEVSGKQITYFKT